MAGLVEFRGFQGLGRKNKRWKACIAISALGISIGNCFGCDLILTDALISGTVAMMTRKVSLELWASAFAGLAVEGRQLGYSGSSSALARIQGHEDRSGEAM